MDGLIAISYNHTTIEARPNYIVCSFDTIDSVGHIYGPARINASSYNTLRCHPSLPWSIVDRVIIYYRLQLYISPPQVIVARIK